MYLKVENICKSYGEGLSMQQVLKDVNLELERGERVIILGPSGSGKSTLLNIIGGLDEADSGNIYLEDLCITSLKNDHLIDYRRDHLGFVFQFYNLIPNLTLKENVELCALLSKDPLEVDDLLKKLGLWDHRDKYPSQVSGGQQQRCSLARALVKNPDLLLCDEPTGALDSKTSQEMLELLERLNQDYQQTMLIVTHNRGIEGMCHRTIELKDGKILRNICNDHIIPASELEL